MTDKETKNRNDFKNRCNGGLPEQKNPEPESGKKIFGGEKEKSFSILSKCYNDNKLMCVFCCECERVCVRERLDVYDCVCVRVYVCEREREREREREVVYV